MQLLRCITSNLNEDAGRLSYDDAIGMRYLRGPVMPQPNSFDLRRLPNDHAANCGEPMFLATVLPADKAGLTSGRTNARRALTQKRKQLNSMRASRHSIGWAHI